MNDTEKDDLDALIASPGWARLKAYAQAEYGPLLMTRVAEETDDAAALLKLRQARAVSAAGVSPSPPARTAADRRDTPAPEPRRCAVMQPLADRVLVRPDPVVTETQSGLALVENWPQETSGVIVSLGAAVRENVKVGDRVIFGQNVGQVVDINGGRLFVMRERDLIAVVNA